MKIATASSTLYVSLANAASGVSRSVIGVGDSTLSSAQPLTTLVSENSGDVMIITFKATQGTTIKHEGRSGWRISDFATVRRTYYKFYVSGVVTAPSVGAYYSNGGTTYDVVEINLTSGNGYINTIYISETTPAPAARGTLSKVSGSGDTTLTYSSTSSDSGNPFWNSSTSQLDFANYLSTNSITLTSNDWVFIHLGIK